MSSTLSTNDSVQKPKIKSMIIDDDKLKKYIRNSSSLLDSDDDDLTSFQFSHGQSNPTYLIVIGSKKFVLRKQPTGILLQGAHDVLREALIIQHLSTIPGVPVPIVHLICRDSSVVGTPFYIMEHISGIVYTDPALPSLSPPQRSMVYTAATAVLANIHNVQLAGTPLEKLGNGYGYCSRQISTWRNQYIKSSQATGGVSEDMETISSWLESNISESNEAAGVSLVHGDFRLDNLVFDPDDPTRILAVLDWELTTVGDPLGDLAYSCLGHYIPPTGFLKKLSLLGRDNSFSGGGDIPDGVPSVNEIIRIYYNELNNIQYRVSNETHINDQNRNFIFFTVFGLFRGSCIASGVYARSLQGNATGGGAGMFKEIVTTLSERCLEIIHSCNDDINLKKIKKNKKKKNKKK
mmetsp:Transcript_22383/g.21616  ORF Transcript_22383/g.21616 Transcript_22383/m.21616 type:complete len:407 (-) Transcript_22383:88-1308(-)